MLEKMARLGYASKAFVYAVVGLLAVAAAANRGGTVTDTRGALRVILSHPFGNAVLFILAAGLCGYAVWRILEALFDPERHGAGAKGLIVRTGNVIKALIYGGVGFEAFRLARGLRASGGSDAKVQSWTAAILSWPMGEWIVAIIGAIAAAYGLSEIIAAVKDSEDEKKDLSSLPRSTARMLDRICRFGVAARALLIVALGVLLIRAALQHDPGEAMGLRGSILELAGTGSGTWVLAIIAVGLIAYALDQALHARYRHIHSPLR